MPAGRILDITLPQENPSGAPGTRGFNISATPAMFGGQIAQAEQTLGQGIERAGTAGLDTAIARQHLDNEIHANDRLTWFTDQATDHYEQYKATEGQAAVNGFPVFKEKLAELQKQVMDGESPQVQKHLSQSLVNISTRYYNWAASHSATESKKWADKSAIDSAGTFGNQAVLSATNGTWDDVDTNLNKSDDEIRKLYEQRGYDQTAISAEVAKQRGLNVKNMVGVLVDQGDIATANAVLNRNKDKMDAASLVTASSRLRTANAQLEGRAVADEESGHRAPAAKDIAGVPSSFIGAIKRTEGFAPTAKWDYKQNTNGYGTRANAPGEKIDRAEADRRFESEITKAAKFVDSINPNLDPGTRAALASLTFNAGTDWAKSGLGDKVRAGDIEGAKQSFLQYNRAGGEVNSGLVARRYREAQWFGQGDAPAGSGMQLGDKAEAYDRVLNRTEGNPLVQSAAIARLNQLYSVAKTETTQQNAQFDLRFKDSQAEIAATGHAANPLTEAEFVQRYGVDQGLQRYEAYTGEMDAAADDASLKTMTPQDQAATLERLAPTPGVPGYAAHQKRFEAAQKAVERITRQRVEDPAGSVSSDAAVMAAAKAVDQKDPKTVQTLAAARLSAQEQSGIPEDSRSPITKAEALALGEPLRRALPGDERMALQSVAETAQKLYGPYAEEAFAYALHAQRFSAEATKDAARVMMKVARGEQPTRDENVAADRAGDVNAADKAVNGFRDFEGDYFNPNSSPRKNENYEKPIPREDIMALRANPKLSARFEEKYGAGAAKKILDAYPQGVGPQK